MAEPQLNGRRLLADFIDYLENVLGVELDGTTGEIIDAYNEFCGENA